MSPDALLASGFLATGFLALLGLVGLVAAALPSKILLRKDWRLHACLGVLAGLIGAANMALPAVHALLAPIGVAPTSTAVVALVFGPVAGLVSAFVVACMHIASHPTGWGLGMGALGGTLVLAHAWHALQRFAGSIPALAGLSLSLPLLLVLLPAARQGLHPLDWSALPWHVGLGVFVLGIAMHLVLGHARAVQALKGALGTLQQREQEMELALESVRGGRWQWHAGRHELQCTGAFYDDFGILQGDEGALAQRWRALRHPGDKLQVQRTLRRALAQQHNESIQVEFRVRDLRGQWRWVVAHCRVAERDAQGQVLRLVGVHLDVTKYREVESSLRSSKAKYTAVYDTMPDPAGITRLSDGRYIEVNPAFCKLLGKERDSIVGRTAQELGIWATPEQFPLLLQTLLRDGQVNHLPALAQRDGHPIPGQISARSVDLDGEACLVFVFHDLRDEQRTTEELLAQNNLLQQAGRLARLGAWEERTGQGTVYWSDVGYQIHGLALDAPLPRDYVQAFVAPAWRPALREKIHDSRQRQVGWSLEIEIVRTDGRTFWARVSGEPVVEEGRVVGMRGVTLDIDEAKRAEQLLRSPKSVLRACSSCCPTPWG